LLIVPALLSTQAIIGGQVAEIVGWMKCWVILSTSLLLELSVTYKLKGRIADGIKILYLLWCLAPIPYNGSEVIFDYGVSPLHWLLVTTAKVLTPIIVHVATNTAHGICQMAVLVYEYVTFVAVKTWITVGSIVAEIPGCFWMIVGKLSVIVNDIPEAAVCVYASTKDLVLYVYSGLAIGGVHVYNAIATCAIYVYSALAICAATVFNALAICAQYVESLLDDCVLYYQENQRNPRLISTMVKQMIFK